CRRPRPGFPRCRHSRGSARGRDAAQTPLCNGLPSVSQPGSKKQEGDISMRFMVLIKANKDSEAGVLPDEKLLTEMGKFNEELGKAGVLIAGEGLHSSSKGARVRFSGAKRTVIDGP